MSRDLLILEYSVLQTNDGDVANTGKKDAVLVPLEHLLGVRL